MKLALEVVEAIFLLLEAAHLVLVGVGHPLVLEVEAVELGVGSVEEALEPVDLDLVLILERKDATTMSALKVECLAVLDLLLGGGEVLVKRIVVVKPSAQHHDDYGVERENERKLAIRHQGSLAD